MKKIALIGMPNSGKSTFFNSISGASAKVANWPGATVDIQSVKTMINGELSELIDLPGIYSLKASSDDEVVVMNYLDNNSVDEIYYILNSTQIDRQLMLANTLIELGYKLRILCNMADEAHSLSIKIDHKGLERRLGVPVHEISAKYHKGYEFLAQKKTKSVILKKFVPIKDAELKKFISYPKVLNSKITSILDNLMLHPVAGLPFFFILLFLLFQFIYGIAEPIQDKLNLLFDWFGIYTQQKISYHLPETLNSFIFDGIYLGVTTILSFVPVIIIFFIVMSFVEDSGYLSRSAFIMDKFMEKIGLDGRGFVMILFGFGCNVPALIGSKIMRSKSTRFLTMLVIPFSLCSARLQVFLFFTAIFFDAQLGALVLFSMYLLSFLIIVITALVFRDRNASLESIIIELPPYRLPSLKQTFMRAYNEIKHFIQRASKFILAGVIMVWIMLNFNFSIGDNHFNMAQFMTENLSPIFSPIGINESLILALIFGFIAKEILIGALAVIFATESTNLSLVLSSQITWQQALSFMTFTLIYTPCLSTIATLKNESKSMNLVIKSLLWSLTLAWIVSYLLYQTLKIIS